MARSKFHFLVTIFLASLASFLPPSSLAISDAEILLTFKQSLSNNTALEDWNANNQPHLCKWKGVLCPRGGFNGLKLDNMGLSGIIDVQNLSQSSNLRTLSVANNNFEGPMPAVNKIGKLKALFLSNNRFSGPIADDAFAGMRSLQQVYLDGNEFNGTIPSSLVSLPLSKLSVEGNKFEGHIPNFQQGSLVTVDFANNDLDGLIPSSLSGMSVDSFTGNPGLCGKPLQPCKSSSKKTLILIIAIVAAVLVLILALALAFLIIRKRRKFETLEKTANKNVQNKNPIKVQQLTNPNHEVQNIYMKDENGGNFQFLRNDRDEFDLQELLRASAEVLGSGSLGSSYKAVLMNGSAMVVKRFRHMNNIGREAFYEHMKKLGRLSHPNLVSLIAFYYRREEKLLISDFANNGSLASHLHGKRAQGQPGLDWPMRLRIIKGVARGLAYLYQEFPTIALPHGHLKSSNVLLDLNFEPVLGDYGLVPILNKDHAHQFMAAYKSPEFNQHDRTTRKTDVWSLGILILELLTGKFPANFLKQGKGSNADLASWVNSVVREEWTGEVFDKEMIGTRSGQGEMLKLLKIGMECCEWNVEKRLDMKSAIESIEEVKEKDTDLDDNSSNYLSEGEVYSSRGVSEDDFSFSINK